ncbi:MAG: type I DNA topoisomerase [Prevotellaceae bacterium]|jgi:DNA topoisomerase-1|nr:type I DNA topoisomerase [Prevotellaceae bacterium]
MTQENLVIVESPAKAKTIGKFLGSKFLVKSSYGHIRDLAKKDFGVDVEHNYRPDYIIPEDKEDLVKELKKLSNMAKAVWLASDEDREGEAIAWHLKETLEVKDSKVRRIVFHEITKDAIKEAVANPRGIDMNLVDAQQARRVLDRLVGFEVSPVLWKKVRPSLSAGRVQSVAVRLIVERERDIISFQSESYFKVTGIFNPIEGKTFSLKAELNEKFKTEKETEDFINACKSASFTISSIEKKPAKKSPAPPFTTSTLQQEASRKFGFSVAQTMSIAQNLYEAGFITYMRTDSTNLSELALDSAALTIKNLYGDKYCNLRRYKTKTKGAQEAHEAIRPTYMENQTIDANSREQKLYELIWKRTLASQMSDASLERTTVNIAISSSNHKFQATGEVLLFDGFLRVYSESQDDESEDASTGGLLPPMKEKQALKYETISAAERFTQRPPRYSEASLVKKMEELGIGRPSTYAPTISTIMNRGYVSKEDRPGVERVYVRITLAEGRLKKEKAKEIQGAEKAKLFPNDIGILVNDFLTEHFKNIVDYNFTAKVEEQFDEIATGELKWTKMIDDFYKPFHKELEKTLDVASRPTSNERVLGVDPKTGKQLSVRMARFGAVAQIGSTDGEEKPLYASLRKGQLIETITLEEALKLFELPRVIGEFEGETLLVSEGRFGPYIRFGKTFVSMKKDEDPYTITQEKAIERIEEKRKKDKEKIISDFGEIMLLNGRFGPYLSYKGSNYKVPKGTDIANITEKICRKIIELQEIKDSKKTSESTGSKTKTPAKKSKTSGKTSKK